MILGCEVKYSSSYAALPYLNLADDLPKQKTQQVLSILHQAQYQPILLRCNLAWPTGYEKRKLSRHMVKLDDSAIFWISFDASIPATYNSVF